MHISPKFYAELRFCPKSRSATLLRGGAKLNRELTGIEIASANGSPAAQAH